MGVGSKILAPPNHPLNNRVSHYFHNPFWGENPLFLVQHPKIMVPQNGWFIMENPIKMDDLGVPLLLETPIYTCQSCIKASLDSGQGSPRTPGSGPAHWMCVRNVTCREKHVLDGLILLMAEILHQLIGSFSHSL